MARLTVLLLCVLALPLTGCLAVAAGAAAGYGTMQYVKNDDVREYAASFPVVWAAALDSMRDAGYPVAPDLTASGTKSEVEVNDATVTAWQVGENRTRVRVRIGTFTTAAHRRLAGQIHDGILARIAGP
ncbi:MAG: DUF3568 family protein [Planctomycetota bacterium]|jgi:hypothetical protein